MSANSRLEAFMAGLEIRNPGEPEFHQAVHEVAASVLPFIEDKPQYREAKILERLTEPDRMIIFRVTWEDRHGQVRADRGFRVQASNAIGPYKGGLRFHPSVTLSILKFLAFEQVFKNSLTGLPMGGAKGGANFDPKGKTDGEIMRFCQSFMTALYRYIGPRADVPAGDIGVGAREISYLFGQYKRLTNRFEGAITGKGLAYGGSQIRVEATGYGCVYMMQDMLRHRGESIEGRTALVSGSGNVAQYTAEKLIEHGAKVLTLSDSSGFVHDPGGITHDRLEFIKELKNLRRGRIKEYADEFGVDYFAAARPWGVAADLAFPSATENEIDADAARELIANGCVAVCEGANMPTTKEGVELFRQARTLFAPSKAANAGGVAISGLELTQNSMRVQWSREELNQRLGDIMRNIHDSCVEYGAEKDYVDYSKGANIAGFVKVADAMLAYGIV